MPVGQFAIRPGALMASADEFEIVVTGQGGHSAQPHTTIDTTLVASQIVVSAAIHRGAQRGPGQTGCGDGWHV